MKHIFTVSFFFIFSAHLSQAQVGINTVNPTETLHVDGTFRLVDGTQNNDFILTSDANGVARWDRISLQIIEGIIGAGVNIPATLTTYVQTGSSIILPPGRFLVTVNMLMSSGNYSPNDSNFWLRTSFSDSPTTINPPISNDLVGGQLISAGLPGSAIFQPLTGSVIINNTSGADKTYYYIAGNVSRNLTFQTLTLFGGDAWGERSIIAIPIN